MTRTICIALGLITLVLLPLQAQSNTKALEMFPADTIFAISVNNIQALTDKLGREELITKYKPFYDQIVAEVQKEAGLNPFTPAGWKSIGFDPAGSAGFAFIAVEPMEAFGIFLPLSDSQKFVNFVNRMASKENETFKDEMVGDARFIYEDDETPEPIMVIKDGYLYLFGGNYKFRKEGLPLVKSYVSMAKSQSLAGNTSFQKAANDLNFGKDVFAYFGVKNLVAEYLTHLEKRMKDDGSDSYANRRLKELKANNGSAEDIKYWQERAKEEMEWQKRYAKRRAAEYDFIKTFFGPVNSLVAGVELGERALEVRCQVDLAPGSMLKDAFGASEGMPLILKKLDKHPLGLFNLAINPATAMKFIEMAMATEGEDFSKMKGEFKRELNLDFDEVTSLFDGELGLALTGKFNLKAKSEEEAVKDLGGMISVKLKDTGKMKSMLEPFAEIPDLAEMIQKLHDINGFVVSIPVWKNVHIGFSENYLLISDDKNFCAGEQGSADFVNKCDHDKVKQFFNMSNPSVVWFMDIGVIGALALMDSMPNVTESSKPFNPQEGEESRQLREEISKLEEEMDKVWQEKRSAEAQIGLRISKRFGYSAVIGKVNANGLRLHGGQFIADKNFAALISGIIDDVMAMEQLSNQAWQKRSQIRSQIRSLENKLRNLENKSEGRWEK